MHSARAIIAVADGGNADHADARVLRTVLALSGEHDKKGGGGLQVAV